ncbi:hypothetical protein Droror1_Dr00025100 [Drosera rotundifolia]
MNVAKTAVLEVHSLLKKVVSYGMGTTYALNVGEISLLAERLELLLDWVGRTKISFVEDLQCDAGCVAKGITENLFKGKASAFLLSCTPMRGEKAKNKELWPNLDRDTSPDAILSTLKDKVDEERNLYIATDECDKSFFNHVKHKDAPIPN